MQVLNPSLLDNILDIANQAGKHLKRFYAETVEVQIKSDKTPVTEADLFISQFVIEQLQALTPTIPILSEESCKIPLAERSQWQEYWIVDPLDGTQQFIDRTDQFSVVIGLVQHNRPVLGVIHAPALNKTYYAMEKHGAFLSENGQTRSLSENGKNQPESDRLLITIGTSSSQTIAQTIQPPYRFDFLKYGSSSLKAGLVAEGKADCYVRFGDTGEWDTAVAEILLAETGGQIFDLRFQPLTYNQRETFVNPYFVMVGNKQRNWQSVFQFN
ncbi:3'(2'),5'-bisphosphate nucleotidase CysQ [Glaesserella sp.]|uniref:3'(2'),5'-bisphosphate nucleotidase CysQ n=1 Tax=Glaesserella sp. TaxID=2094731 RepID=UPI00359FB28B